jgi:hypothetical protein
LDITFRINLTFDLLDRKYHKAFEGEMDNPIDFLH